LLQRLNKRGAQRKRRRIEDLIQISVHDEVTHRGRAFYHNGPDNWIEFCAEEIDGQYFLSFHQVDPSEQFAAYLLKPTHGIASYPIIEVPIKGHIKNELPWDKSSKYLVLDTMGNRCRHLYIDPVKKEIGSRHELKLVWTSESISAKQRVLWREMQRIKRMAH
jgi:hypothetical protein